MNHAYLLKLQCSQLSLLIALSQETKRWGERTVIMRKGQLTSVGGEIMPKDPPSFRILTPEQWIRFVQGDIKNFRDIDRKEDKSSGYVAALSSLASLFTGIQFISVEQGGQADDVVQSVFQEQNREKITKNIVDTTPVKNKNFVQGILEFISEAKNGFQSAIDSTIEKIKNQQWNSIVNVEGNIAGGLLLAGVAAMGVIDVALFSAAIPAISTKILFSLAKIPIGLFMKKCWEYSMNFFPYNERFVSEEDKENIKRSLPKEIQEEIFGEVGDEQIQNYARRIISHTPLASSVVAPDKESFQLLVQRLSAEKQKEFINDGSSNQISYSSRRPKLTIEGTEVKVDDRHIKKSFVNEKYTLERRLIELDDILREIENEEYILTLIPSENILIRSRDYLAHKEALQNLIKSYTWHKGIIQAELKYGSALDKLLYSENVEKGTEAMQELVSKLQSGKGSDSNNIKRPDDDDPILFLKGRRINAVADSLEQISQMSAMKPDIEVGYTAERGYNRPLPNGGNFINTGDIQPSDFLAYHEFGHSLEHVTQLSPVTRSYINSRSYSSTPVEIKTIIGVYPHGESTRVTDFIDPYISKTYGSEGLLAVIPSLEPIIGTEVVSMSLQNLVSPQALANKLSQDRDHMLYGLWALDYKPKLSRIPDTKGSFKQD